MIFAAYLITSFFAYGLTLGFFSKKFPYFNNTGIAIMGAFFGPIGLLASIFTSLIDFSFTFRLSPISRKERWEIYKKTYPALSVNRSIDTFEY